MFKKSLSPLFLLLSSLVIAGCDNAQDTSTTQSTEKQTRPIEHAPGHTEIPACTLYPSDAAAELTRGDFGGYRWQDETKEESKSSRLEHRLKKKQKSK
ncbi:hypothetical protein ACEE86_04615, partial [Proteus mirabilis]